MLKGIILLKNLFLRPKKVDERLKWSYGYLQSATADWEREILSDESIFVLFGQKGGKWVRISPESAWIQTAFENCKKWRKKVMLWVCFTASGTGTLSRINGTMVQTVCKKLLVNHLKRATQKLRPKSSNKTVTRKILKNVLKSS